MENLLIQKIFAKIKREPRDIAAYEDMFSYCRNLEEEDFELAHSTNQELRRFVGEMIRQRVNAEAFFGLYKKTLLFDAPHFFDAYMLYLEINRRPQERFYQPRRKVLKRLVDSMQKLADNELDELFISMPPRVGKALADDTPVLTSDGWKNHGDIKVGDMVIGLDGEFKRVIAVHPKCMLDCRVTFSNGDSFVCHENHEWVLSKITNKDQTAYKNIETKELIKEKLFYIHTEKNAVGSVQYKYKLPRIEPIVGEKKELPLDPYTFGAWLGDGTNKQPRIATTEKDYAIIEKIVANGSKIKAIWKDKRTNVLSVCFDFRDKLQKCGLCYSQRTVEKHISEEYMTASIEDRLELLAGLLDTDGYLDKKRYRYTTVEKQLANDVCSLASSFGWKAYIYHRNPHGNFGKKDVYSVEFSPTFSIPCVLERKRIKEFSCDERFSLKSIERVDAKQGNCITVEGGIYLVGRRFIPTHNTSILMFYMTWLIGRDCEKANLYCAYSDTITKAFYNGVMEIINDPNTYGWKDVFPESKIVATNSQEETLNINRRKRYPSLTCRSLYGTLNGAVDVNGVLMSDDLIGGIEEALNKDRMISTWEKTDNNMLTRAKEGCKILWCGTRWSMIDPAGLRMELLQNDEQYKNRRFEIINLSALDENDESRFDYDYGVGFSTEYYRMRRASFERNNDMASWNAQYMGEPIEREGALFTPDEFRYYNGVLPEGEPDRIFMAVDPAFGGGDFVAAPVCFQYGDDIYVHDVVYDSGEKNITQPLLIQAITKYNVAAMQIEANKSTEAYKDEIQEELKKQGIKINLTSKPASSNTAKCNRIFDKASDIREMMIFREDGKRSKPYSLFMQNVFSYKMFAKNKNDDAPDSLAMAIDMVKRPSRKAEVFKRMF